MCQPLSSYDSHLDSNPLLSHQKNTFAHFPAPPRSMLINEMASVYVCFCLFSEASSFLASNMQISTQLSCCLLKGTLMYIFASHNATLSKCGGLCISFVASVLSFLTSNLEMQVLTNSSVHFLTSHQRNYYSCNSIRTHTVFHYTTWWASTEPAAVGLAQAFIN